MTDSFLEHVMDLLKSPTDLKFRESLIARIPSLKRFNRHAKSIPRVRQISHEPEVSEFLRGNNRSCSIIRLTFHS